MVVKYTNYALFGNQYYFIKNNYMIEWMNDVTFFVCVVRPKSIDYIYVTSENYKHFLKELFLKNYFGNLVTDCWGQKIQLELP